MGVTLRVDTLVACHKLKRLQINDYNVSRLATTRRYIIWEVVYAISYPCAVSLELVCFCTHVDQCYSSQCLQFFLQLIFRMFTYLWTAHKAYYKWDVLFNIWLTCVDLFFLLRITYIIGHRKWINWNRIETKNHYGYSIQSICTSRIQKCL